MRGAISSTGAMALLVAGDRRWAQRVRADGTIALLSADAGRSQVDFPEMVQVNVLSVEEVNAIQTQLSLEFLASLAVDSLGFGGATAERAVEVLEMIAAASPDALVSVGAEALRHELLRDASRTLTQARAWAEDRRRFIGTVASASVEPAVAAAAFDGDWLLVATLLEGLPREERASVCTTVGAPAELVAELSEDTVRESRLRVDGHPGALTEESVNAGRWLLRHARSSAIFAFGHEPPVATEAAEVAFLRTIRRVQSPAQRRQQSVFPQATPPWAAVIHSDVIGAGIAYLLANSRDFYVSGAAVSRITAQAQSCLPVELRAIFRWLPLPPRRVLLLRHALLLSADLVASLLGVSLERVRTLNDEGLAAASGRFALERRRAGLGLIREEPFGPEDLVDQIQAAVLFRQHASLLPYEYEIRTVRSLFDEAFSSQSRPWETEAARRIRVQAQRKAAAPEAVSLSEPEDDVFRPDEEPGIDLSRSVRESNEVVSIFSQPRGSA